MHKFPQNHPQVEKREHTLEKHGHKRIDPYFWLREKENPKVIDYLKAENQYLEEVMSPYKKVQSKIFDEMKSRIKEDESSAPILFQGYYYYSRFETGGQYPIFARRKSSMQAAEEILINVSELAKPHKFYQSTGPIMSPNQKMMAYGYDTQGRRFYTFEIKDLTTNKNLPFKIESITPNLVWAEDNEHVFYTKQDPETLRAYQIFRYNIKTQKQELIYTEKDETFSVNLYRSLARKYIYILCYSTLSTEVLYIDSQKPTTPFKVFYPREKEHEYSVYEDDQNFYILSNWNAKNFRLMKSPLNSTDRSAWTELLPHQQDEYLQDLVVFKDHFALQYTSEGLPRLRVYTKGSLNPYEVPFEDATYDTSFTGNIDYKSASVRYEYESLRVPKKTYDLNLKTTERKLAKAKEVPNYNPDLYVSERVWATARDGQRIPISLVMRKDTKKDGTAPLLMYGYGSYGYSMTAYFSGSIYSLIDRGFVYAIAHIRGGSELGRQWYDNGRVLNKLNTFYDFIDATEFLLKQKYASREKVYAMGGSAGGLLMGSIMNFRPDLYRGIVASVPFVDVITTMLDDSIPLTTSEYDEWGNPNEKQYYDYMLKYSPYDNIERKDYPNLLVITGFHDSQVQYWEPAKWVAKVREYKTNDSLVLFKTDLSAGHSGASGRFDHLLDTALEFTFILATLEPEKYKN